MKIQTPLNEETKSLRLRRKIRQGDLLSTEHNTKHVPIQKKCIKEKPNK